MLRSAQGAFRTVPGSGLLNFADEQTLAAAYSSKWTAGATLIDQIPLAPTLTQSWSLLSVSATAYLGLLAQGGPAFGLLGKLLMGLVLRGQPSQQGASAVITPMLPLPSDASLVAPLWDGSQDQTPPSLASIATQGNPGANCSAGANNASQGAVAWTSPGNIAIGGQSATCAMGAGQSSQLLVASGFGFNVPAGATITGVQATINKASSKINEFDSTVSLVLAGTPSGANRASSTAWPTGAGGNVVYGSSSDLWGLSLQPADVNNAGFGVCIAGQANVAACTLSVAAFVTITVYYTTPMAGTSSLLPVSATVSLPVPLKMYAGQQPCVGLWLTPSLLGCPIALTLNGPVVAGATYNANYDDGQ